MRSIVGLGAGGHAEILIEILRAAGDFEFVGLLDAADAMCGREVAGVRVLGGDARLPELAALGIGEAFVGLAGFGSAAPRRTVIALAEAAGFSFPIIVHARAWMSPSARAGAGCQLLAGVIVNTSTTLGNHVIVNSAASIDHHCRIGDFVHIAPGAVLAGRVVIDEAAQIGAGATVRDGVRIGAGAIVGAGATVLADVDANKVVAGTPAREIRNAC